MRDDYTHVLILTLQASDAHMPAVTQSVPVAYVERDSVASC